MIDSPLLSKLPLMAVLSGALFSLPYASPAAQAALAIESATAVETPLTGTPFQLDIVGDGFDANTRIILHLDSGNRSALIAGLPTANVAREVHVVGELAYVLTDGVAIVNISDPASPLQLGFFDASSFGMETMGVRGNVVYAADNGLIRAINVSNPASPFMVGGVSVPGTASRMQVVADRAYVATNSGLHVLNLSDPANPALIGSSTSIDALDLVVVGNLAICAVRGGLVTIDVTNLSAPVILGSLTLSGETFGVSVSGSTAYVVNTFNGFLAIDISDPGSPVQIGELPMSSHSVRVQTVGNRTYVAGGDSGIHIVDTQDPTNPILIGRVNMPGSSTDLAVEGTTAYIADWEAGLQIVDIGNPNPSQILGGLDIGLADSIEVEGTVAYFGLPRSVFGSGGLRTVDISNPAQPALLGSVATDGVDVAAAGDIAYLAGNHAAGLLVIGGATIQVVGQYAFIARRNKGYAIVDISDEMNPRLVATGVPGRVGLTVNGSVAVQVGFGGFVQTLDVSNPVAPFVLGTATIPFAGFKNPYRATIVGDLVYVGDFYSGIYVVDISVPATPKLLATLDTPGFARGVRIVGQRIYIADNFMGLTILPTPVVDPVFSVVDAMHLRVSVPALEAAGSYSVKVISVGASDIIHGAFSVAADTDGDGVPDNQDAFPNDPTETIDTDNDGIGNNADMDDDNDGMPDGHEIRPLDASDANSDADGDGFTNLEEFVAGTDPLNAAEFPVARKVPVSVFILLGEDEE